MWFITERYKLLLLLLFSFVSFQGVCCLCDPLPIKKEIKRTKYIIRCSIKTLLDTTDIYNNPVSVNEREGSYEVLVTINEPYKWQGKKPKEIKISSTFSSCDMFFKKNEEYILFLNKYKGKYYIQFCSYNMQIDNAEHVIKALRD